MDNLKSANDAVVNAQETYKQKMADYMEELCAQTWHWDVSLDGKVLSAKIVNADGIVQCAYVSEYMGGRLLPEWCEYTLGQTLHHGCLPCHDLRPLIYDGTNFDEAVAEMKRLLPLWIAVAGLPAFVQVNEKWNHVN